MSGFKIGDVVQLKSGGPLMTINSVEESEYYCQWFVDNKMNDGSFHRDSLELYTPPESHDPPELPSALCA